MWAVGKASVQAEGHYTATPTLRDIPEPTLEVHKYFVNTTWKTERDPDRRLWRDPA